MIYICPHDRLNETIPLGQRFFDYAGEIGTFNPESFLAFWDRMYATEMGFIFLSETNGIIDGAFGLVFQHEFLTGLLIATEVFWYSEGLSGLKLFKAAENAAEKCGAKIMYIQHLNDDSHEKISRFYDRDGFKLKYYRYVKEL